MEPLHSACGLPTIMHTALPATTLLVTPVSSVEYPIESDLGARQQPIGWHSGQV